VDFVSFDPRVPERLQFFCIRYVPDRDYLAMLEEEVIQFLKEVDAKFKQLQEKVDSWECVSR
jgi:hypothetical protein